VQRPICRSTCSLECML